LVRSARPRPVKHVSMHVSNASRPLGVNIACAHCLSDSIPPSSLPSDAFRNSSPTRPTLVPPVFCPSDYPSWWKIAVRTACPEPCHSRTRVQRWSTCTVRTVSFVHRTRYTWPPYIQPHDCPPLCN
jgi:hypothetical protein